MYDLNLLGTTGTIFYWLMYGVITGCVLAAAIYMFLSSQSCNKLVNYPTSPSLRKATGMISLISSMVFLIGVGIMTLLCNYMEGVKQWYETEWGVSCTQQWFVLLFMPFLCYYLHAVLQGAVRIKVYIVGLCMLFPAFLLVWTLLYGVMYEGAEVERFSLNILHIVRVYWLIFIVALLYSFTKSLRDYDRKLKEMYSDVSARQVKWLYMLVVLNVIYFAWFIAVYYFGLPLSMGAMVQHVLALVITMYACYHADRQRLIVWESEASNVAEKEQYRRSMQDLDRKLQLWLEKKEYLHQDFTRDDLLEALSTNRTYLNMYFTINNTSFYQFINVHRIEYAISLMTDQATSYKLSEVAVACGYNSLEVFSRQFKAIKGCLPSQYRVGRVKVSNNEKEP